MYYCDLASFVTCRNTSMLLPEFTVMPLKLTFISDVMLRELSVSASIILRFNSSQMFVNHFD